MTPKAAPRSWFSTIVGSFLAVGALVAYAALPGRLTDTVTLGVILIGGIMIQGEKIVEALRARFGRSDG